MLPIALAFLLGNLCLQQLPNLTTQSLAIPVIGVMALCLTRCFIPRIRYVFTTPVIVAFLLGFVWAGIHAQLQLRQDLRTAQEGVDVLVSGTISEIPEQESYGQRFVLTVVNSEMPLPAQLELTWYSPAPRVHAAERWQLQVRLKRRHGFANPGGHDYESQLFRRGIGATGYVRDSDANRLLGLATDQHILRARAWLTAAIAEALPNTPMQGVVRGLAVGDQQAIASDAWQVFARTGTSHLMAISGFHIGMVALVFAWLGARLVYLPMAQRWRLAAPDLRAVFGMTAAVGYSLLAGMSVPTQRTLTMLAVYFGASLLRRELNVWQGFGLALLLVLLIDPFAPLSAGAWLSFGAVAVILLNQSGRIGPMSWWRNFFSVQGVVSLGLVPLLLSTFGNLSLVSPLVNLIAIPLFTAVLVPAVLLASALLAITPTLGVPALQGIAVLIQWVYVGLQWAAQLPWATWYAPAAPWWAMGLLVIGTVMMILPWTWPLRFSGALACLPALFPVPAAPAPGDFELTTLDVGQGLAVVVRTARHVLVYDTGPVFQSGRDTGELVVLPYLRAQGVRKLDALMLSHGDADHVGGAYSLQAGMPVARVSAGPSVQSASLVTPCTQGQRWQWDGVQFAVLHPQAQSAGESDNNSSCVLRVSAAGGSALLLGDIETPAERALVAAGLIQPTEIVVAAHHGSRSSSTAELIDAAQVDGRPQWVVFSTGYRNRWNFPREEVVARWQWIAAMPVNTADSGAVTFQVRPQAIELSAYRTQHPRYWQAR